ncbi:hypothetical protein [Caloranaerobacter azorensis]|uniref:PH domain-containing protein n=1 Tax=Caloranaerobacter azorensis TaxID=116090 RepID=A0A6P1YD55_9FIRM|nr:hypothetical protein [Caloranaerobacter azorensis]QIB26718.1 hypothetical protein G3A45_05030 [Caloranaerobacter azorensis]
MEKEKEFNLCFYSVIKTICFDVFIIILVIIFTGTENLDDFFNIIIPVLLFRWILGIGDNYKMNIDRDQIICYSIYGKKIIRWSDVKKVEFDEIRMGRFSSLGFIFYINKSAGKTKKRIIYIKHLNEKVEIKNTIKKICAAKKIEFKDLLNESQN